MKKTYKQAYGFYAKNIDAFIKGEIYANLNDALDTTGLSAMVDEDGKERICSFIENTLVWRFHEHSVSDICFSFTKMCSSSLSALKEALDGAWDENEIKAMANYLVA